MKQKKKQNVIPILFTIEQMQIKTVIDHKLKHTHIYTQTNKQQTKTCCWKILNTNQNQHTNTQKKIKTDLSLKPGFD